MRIGLLLVLSTVIGCGNNGSGGDMGGQCGGGPVAGAADMHCASDGGLALITAMQSQCNAPPQPSSGPEFGDTMYGSMGYDDDCKYAVSFTIDPICAKSTVSITVTAKDALTMKPITGASTSPNMMRLEVFQSDVLSASVAGVTVAETSPGVYKFSNVVFPTSGRWQIRFHFFENCVDLPDSPHGHAAFYIDVP
jgi:hypothetical protein